LVAGLEQSPEGIPEEAYCQRCVAVPNGAPNTISKADGSFELTVSPGQAYELVVQKGQFRRVRKYVAPTEIGYHDIPDTLTTLPNRANQAEGDMIPKIAVVHGDYDSIEDVLAKVGIGETDNAYGHQWGSEQDIFDVYANTTEGPERGPSVLQLLNDPTKLAQYHLIFFACSQNAIFEFMANPQIQNNIRGYVEKGGKIYVSDYAYTVVELVWPEFIWFTNPLRGGCVENRFPDGCNHGPAFDPPSRSLDSKLSEWLFAVDETVTGVMPQAEFVTLDNWNTIGGTFASYIGDDANGAPVHEKPKVWMEGTWAYSDEQADSNFDRESYHPLAVSWPYGCGRVLYTTYHTVGGTNGNRHPGLLTQELSLWHLVLELQACTQIL
jgi:hypothetical protein